MEEQRLTGLKVAEGHEDQEDPGLEARDVDPRPTLVPWIDVLGPVTLTNQTPMLGASALETKSFPYS